MEQIIKQRDWTVAELKAFGCRYYTRKKQLVMAARLPDVIAPMEIHYPLETAVAEQGDVICFDPGQEYHAALLEYDHWSVKLDIFMKTYLSWDEEELPPSLQVGYFLQRGCKPYYKAQGAWAKRLEEALWIQSLENPEPMEVPAGMWLMIGSKGEPWHVEDDKFRERYYLKQGE